MEHEIKTAEKKIKNDTWLLLHIRESRLKRYVCIISFFCLTDVHGYILEPDTVVLTVRI